MFANRIITSFVYTQCYQKSGYHEKHLGFAKYMITESITLSEFGKSTHVNII